ncbi:ATP-binding cassette domain-containing protein [Coprococcus comes]|uniref:ATP-binding cassette domain-containing protein n=1 Tax=Coprococcus comes TaxID=410072 RepID=UPI001FAD8025|nr:ABC transporter ATP-binding protein [Coprococcus comes]
MKNYILRINDILCEDVETNNHYKINEFKNLSIKNISFKYSENSPILLNGINIHIAKGQKIAIVGESGSGKSTIVKLLLGLYEPMMGNVQFNGINMEDLDKNQLKKIIGVMPQDAKLFNGSIKYNIMVVYMIFINMGTDHVFIFSF